MMGNQISFIILVMILGCFSVYAGAEITREENTDRPGMDYNTISLDTPDPSLCEQACRDDDKCKAYTYVKPGVQGKKANCWLKSSVPDPVPSNDCVSGVVQEGSSSFSSAEKDLLLLKKQDINAREGEDSSSQESVKEPLQAEEMRILSPELQTRIPNRTSPLIGALSAFPDLKPTKIDVPSNVKSTDTFPVTIEVQNIGLADAGASVGHLSTTWTSDITKNPDGTAYGSAAAGLLPEFNVPALQTGKATKVTVSYGPTAGAKESGKLTIGASVNYARTLKESDYSNNDIAPVVIVISAASTPVASFEEQIADAIYTKTNAARSADGKASLTRNKNLDAIALKHSNYMASENKYSHDNWNTRKVDIYNLGFSSVGENVATTISGNVNGPCNAGLHSVPNTPDGLAENTVDMWMNHDSCQSNMHRTSILNSMYTDVGIAVAKGSTHYYITQDFGGK
jgi:uncharacterized protein YkwD